MSHLFRHTKPVAYCVSGIQGFHVDYTTTARFVCPGRTFLCFKSSAANADMANGKCHILRHAVLHPIIADQSARLTAPKSVGISHCSFSGLPNCIATSTPVLMRSKGFYDASKFSKHVPEVFCLSRIVDCRTLFGVGINKIGDKASDDSEIFYEGAQWKFCTLHVNANKHSRHSLCNSRSIRGFNTESTRNAEHNVKSSKHPDTQAEKQSASTGDLKERHGVIMTVPNALTTLRMAMTPLLGYLVLNDSYSMACIVFVLAGITDLLDGFIARQFVSQTSALGSFIDPLADKLLVSVLFVTLTMVDLIPVLLTALVLTRDVFLMAAGFYVRYISLPHPCTLRQYFDLTNPSAELQPTFISKLNTAVQLSLVALTLAAPVFHYVDHPYMHGLWYLTAGTTIVSGIGYIFAKNTFKIVKQSRNQKL